jgi:hypothetical protein
MGSEERKIRARQRRQSAVITRAELMDAESGLETLRGPEAMSLAWRLTREAWSLSGQPWPDYDRASIPHRFKPE